MTIGIIGTGNVATSLGRLLQAARHQIIFGSRDPRAEGEKLSSFSRVMDIPAAIESGEVVILAVPYLAVKEIITNYRHKLAGKVVVDVTNPLQADWSPVVLGAENSAGEEVARLLPEAKVVKAFNTIFADVMKAEKLVFDGANITAFVCGDDASANAIIVNLASQMGLDALAVGDMKNARYLEAVAHLNIQIAVGMGGGTDAAFKYFRRS